MESQIKSPDEDNDGSSERAKKIELGSEKESALFSKDLYGASIESRREKRKVERGIDIKKNLSKHTKFGFGRCLNCRYEGQMGLIETAESKKRLNQIRIPSLIWLVLLFLTRTIDDGDSTFWVLMVFSSPFFVLAIMKVDRIMKSYAECPGCLSPLRF